MTHISLTGANGFLGWHTRAAATESELKSNRIALGEKFDVVAAADAMSGTPRLIHLAGVNRGTEEEVADGNVLFARQIAESLRRTSEPPQSVVFANSTQAANGSVYGDAKAEAATILQEAAVAAGVKFEDVRLPNVFGEHGKPFYNAVTATFCHLLARGSNPTLEHDKELTLLHAQDAADLLLGTRDANFIGTLEVRETVSGLLSTLEEIAKTYGRGEIPDISTPFQRNLFNTYRSHTFPFQAPVQLTRHADERGSFFEIVRSHGGAGQSSFSTTNSGVSRGNHFHRRKVERFTVLAGQATITLRRLFTDELVEFFVEGSSPVAVDMPTMWAHKITNRGDEVLYTSFWTNDIFDPIAPDTIAEAV